MKAWVGWITLGLSVFVVYLGYQNSQLEPSTEIAARAVACVGQADCDVRGERPRKIKADFTRRIYQWETPAGSVHVVCRRAFMLLGAWSCEPRPGSLDDKL